MQIQEVSSNSVSDDDQRYPPLDIKRQGPLQFEGLSSDSEFDHDHRYLFDIEAQDPLQIQRDSSVSETYHDLSYRHLDIEGQVSRPRQVAPSNLEFDYNQQYPPLNRSTVLN